MNFINTEPLSIRELNLECNNLGQNNVNSKPLHSIIFRFKKDMDNNRIEGRSLKKEIAEKIVILSNKKINYYHNSQFGLVIQFISALRNLFLFGTFTSSGVLGLQMATKCLGDSKNDDELFYDCEEYQSEEEKKEVSEEEKKEVSEEEKKEVFYDCDEDDQEPTPDTDSPTLVNAFPSNTQSLRPQSLREAMLETIQSIWSQAPLEDVNYIVNIWKLVMAAADVVKWEKVPDVGDRVIYRLQSSNEPRGTAPGIPGQVVIQKQMQLEFLKDAAGLHIALPDGGIVHEVGSGWFTAQTHVKKISVGRNGVTIEASNMLVAPVVTKSRSYVQGLWSNTVWS